MGHITLFVLSFFKSKGDVCSSGGGGGEGVLMKDTVYILIISYFPNVLLLFFFSISGIFNIPPISIDLK